MHVPGSDLVTDIDCVIPHSTIHVLCVPNNAFKMSPISSPPPPPPFLFTRYELKQLELSIEAIDAINYFN